MDSIYNHSTYATSLNCTGAINGNTDTRWRPTSDPNPNCVYDNPYGPGERYWQVDLGQTRNIHRITIYPEMCADGYYGETCDNTCSAGCSNTCNKQDGTCNCRTGWSGDKCDACSDGYYKITATGSSDCRKCGAGCETTSCEDVTGSCTCRPGWQSPTCQVCKTKLWGDNCTMTCGACAGDGSCDRITGACYSGRCVAGIYGGACGKACPPGCDGPCHVITGNCSCRSQWRQPGCTECSAGHYSPSLGCKPCGAGCEDVTSCDPLTGLCSCQRGWVPPTCHANFVDGGSNTGAIVGSVVGVGVVICITILVTGLLIRSRRLPQPTLEHSETPRNSAAEGHEAATECRADLEATNEEGIGEQGDVSHNYDTARSYENADDIRFYTSLQTNRPSTHGPQYANTTTATANYENLYVTTDNQYENIPNVKMM